MKPGRPRHMRVIVCIRGTVCVLNIFVFRILPAHYSKTHYFNGLYIAINRVF